MIKASKHFDKTFLEKIQKILLEKKEELEKKLGKIATKNPNVEGEYDANYVDVGSEEDDNVHEVEVYEVNKATEENLEKELRDVNAALDRLKKGKYGICKYTNKPINKKRLLARPTSSASIEAKKYLQNT